MGSYNRRIGARIPLQMFLNEYSKDRQQRCMSVNIGLEGIYLNRLAQPEGQDGRIVGLEFELPGTSEVVWARGEIVYDRVDPYFHGTGVRFAGMAGMHQKLVEEYVEEQRARSLEKLLAVIKRNRRWTN